MKRFVVVGMADGVLREARERVRCAIENSGFTFPYREVVVSLAPAALPKSGSGFDLAIALGILGADGQLDPALLRQFVFYGELALDGRVKPLSGVLAAAAYVRAAGGGCLMVSAEAAQLAALTAGIKVIGVRSLLEAIAFLRKDIDLPAAEPLPAVSEPRSGVPTFADVIGQYAAKRAAEIAAAGGHNLFLIGPPGAGKSMIAQRMASIMPPLVKEEILELSRIYGALSASGQPLDANSGERERALIVERPFRAPHHTSSTAGLIGGGAIPLPGEVSLAHKGILFLDEFLEMRRDTVEALREPLENKYIALCRAKMRVRFPADFTLVAAANPCPCGKRGVADASGASGCRCGRAVLARYFARLSGPIMDRIDMSVWVSPVPISEFHNRESEDPTPAMKQRVAQARAVQQERNSARGLINARLGTRDLRKFCVLDSASLQLIEDAAKKFRFSARGYTKTLKLARTIADLESAAEISAVHIAEALSYRVQPAA